MTNTGPFLWNGSSKMQFFTNILYSFWQRLKKLLWQRLKRLLQRLKRLRELKKVSNGWSGINFPYSGTQ